MSTPVVFYARMVSQPRTERTLFSYMTCTARISLQVTDMLRKEGNLLSRLGFLHRPVSTKWSRASVERRRSRRMGYPSFS